MIRVVLNIDSDDNPWGVMERFITGQWEGLTVTAISAEAVNE